MLGDLCGRSTRPERAVDGLTDGSEVLDPRYGALYERVLAVLDRDERVKGVEISGSVGSDTADRWSDLDLQVIAHADRYDELLADWPNWLAAITPTVFARTPIARS